MKAPLATSLSESLAVDVRGNTNHTWSAQDPAGAKRTTWSQQAGIGNLAEEELVDGATVRTVSHSAVTNTIACDAFRRQIATTDGRGSTAVYRYDAAGRLVAQTDAATNTTFYAYDQSGRLVAATNALGNVTRYEYDLRGNKTYEGGATYPVRYTYDAYGNKIAMTTYRDESSGAGDTTHWLYDEASNCMTNKVYADGRGPSYDYDAYGRLVKRTWARGIETTYAYDGWNNLTNTTYSDDTPSITLRYDSMGRQAQAVDAAGTTTFAYDDFGSLTNETVVGVAGTNTIERFTDAFGRDAGYALNGVRQSTLGYDPATGRLATMLAAGSATPFSWNYLAGSDLKQSLTYPNGLSATWQYDAKNQLLQVCNAFSTNVVSQYDYTYDAVGRRVQIARSGSAMSEPRIDCYGYNERSELVLGTKDTAATNLTEYAYQYDDIGNRLSSLDLGTNRTYTANALNQYTQISNLAASVSLREEFVPQFDADGNQTQIKTATGVWSVTYNGENRPILWSNLSNVSNPSNISHPSNDSNVSHLIAMSFDRMGRRVTKNDKRFVYDGYLQIADNTGNAYIWDPTEPVATRPLVWNHNDSVAYYAFDGNKNVSEVIASDGTISAHYEYAPFGALIVQRGESSLANSWRFSSEYSDDEIGNVYYILRHYDPITGNWMMRDPAGDLYGGLYGFCANNSISYWDSTGAFLPVLIPLGAAIAEEIARAAVAAAIAAAIATAAKQIADVTTMPRCPEPECLPCKPPVGTVGFRTDIVPPSKPHYPHKGTHTHLYIVNQSPVNKGCKCFWRPVKSIEGDIPPRGSVPMNGSPAGGGVTFK